MNAFAVSKCTVFSFNQTKLRIARKVIQHYVSFTQTHLVENAYFSALQLKNVKFPRIM